MSGGEAPRSAGSRPSAAQQKTFIVQNAGILNKETKISILSIVMMEIGPEVVKEIPSAHEVDVNLDAVALSNEEVLGHIYNIVRARLSALNQPARGPSSRETRVFEAPRPLGGGPVGGP